MQTTLEEQLKRPFKRSDIEFRVGSLSESKRKVQALAYVTARGIMNRLDEVFGIDGWSDEYELLADGVKCKLSVRIGERWITKEDAAPFTARESLKGGFSDALKRTGVKLGIGRYLYNLPQYWVPVIENRPQGVKHVNYINSDKLRGFWIEPELPDWALPSVQDNNRAKEKTALSHKLVMLMDKGIITEGKAADFDMDIKAADSNDKLSLINRRLKLLEKLYQVSCKVNITHNEKTALYRDILSANNRALAKLAERIENIASGEAA